MQTPISLKPLVTALVIVLLAWAGLTAYINSVGDGETQVERSIVLSLRQLDDPGQMVGPPWLEEAARDFTALGGYAVMLTVIISFSAFVGLRHGRGRVRFFLVTTLCGYACGMLLKAAFGRDRPSIVPHLSHVATSSFPSVHSMMSSIVYLTIGLMLARELRDHGVRRVLVTLPLCLTFLVGSSRVLMGVHYPSDVLAGWAAGLTWTCVAFRLDRWLKRRGTISA